MPWLTYEQFEASTVASGVRSERRLGAGAWKRDQQTALTALASKLGAPGLRAGAHPDSFRTVRYERRNSAR